jgi:hypothetical protein
MRKDEQTRVTRVVDPTPPFDFALSSYIFSDGDPQIAQYDDGTYRQVLRAGNKLMLAAVTLTGSVETPQLQVIFASDRSLTNRDVAAARAVISSVFNVHLDFSEFYTKLHDDPVMSELTQQLRGWKNPGTATVFEALFNSIVE